MEKIVVRGGAPLSGSVTVSGMKNAALPILYACVLVGSKCTIENVPDVRDVRMSLDILAEMGAEINRIADETYEIDCTNFNPGISCSEKVKKLRASYYLMGAELGRFGKAKVAFPGGCNFGTRPIDQHIKGFETLGATVTTDCEFITMTTESGTVADDVYFDTITVGGTINIILAAVMAKGNTIIENAAREPHIVDLANFLNSCGARISGAGTDVIKIRGVKSLHGSTYAIIPDMIEAGTYMAAAAATGGCVRIENVIPKHLEAITGKLEDVNVIVEELDDAVIVTGKGLITSTRIKTRPYPGFPTDMHPQMSALLTIAHGTSIITEGVYETRFRYTEELRKMGADIEVKGHTAVISGVDKLHGAKVQAVDLRAGVAMVIAGLVAEGETKIYDIHLIERGYDDIVGKLRALGANIEKVVEEE
ncbi:MAG: UDP-N-acetylglucosamine 1-carboxyvinyltransferase [Ruminococcaceae bacterium]|nr:UDP-N-acetylglucosamine 1-carboxyvinyltransferase [Oscillospiraceae bacterium]